MKYSGDIMDYVKDIKESCDSIEEKIYEFNNTLREKGSNEEITLELNAILTIIKNIKSNVNEDNAYNVRSELLSIQKDIDALFNKSINGK